MENSILNLASAIIAKSSRECPADAVLRQELRAQRDLFPADAALVSHMVFSYYRWLGWLEKKHPLMEQITLASQLAERFAKEPGRFSDSELMELSIPGWTINEVQVSPEWIRSLQTEPELWLRARLGQGSSLARELKDCDPVENGRIPEALRYSGHEDLFRTPAFHAGRFEIQDLSSQAVGLVCNPRPGEVWWDACSGEGGKTLHLSDLMHNQGLIWASDRAAWRLQKLKRRAARAQIFNYRTRIWEGLAKLPTKTKFDGVLLDAPCTGIGTWQRNPHARWTTTPQDIAELSRLQKQLLSNASAGVKPQGKLLYSVCTMARSETLEVVEAFEAEHPEFARLQIENPLDRGNNSSKEIWLWPQHHAANGMFIVGWVKC